MQKYLALVEEDNGNYGVVFPDLPGVVSAGTSFEDAVKNAREIVAYAAEQGSLPEARTLEEIKQTWEDWEEWKRSYNFVVTYVPVVAQAPKIRRITIVMDEDLLSRLDMIAIDRSNFINRAVEAALV
jgi:hypothetical protein